jgi:hypothetical protein
LESKLKGKERRRRRSGAWGFIKNKSTILTKEEEFEDEEDKEVGAYTI